MDFFPTMLELAGLPLTPDRHADGRSIVSLLQGKSEFPERTLYWHYPHYHGSTWAPGASVRDGDWKLIEFYHYGNFELYNLREDPGETTDLSQRNVAKAKELRAKLMKWQAKMGARMPVRIPVSSN
jgi:arylsulfatase A-like enzyme